MANWNPKADEIFLAANKMQSLEERRAYLAEACAGDEGLRAEVVALLRAGEAAGSFLEKPAAARFAGIDSPPSNKTLPPEAGSQQDVITAAQAAIGLSPGLKIGPYKLLEQIGEGGMGTVWMAEQVAPVRRMVALKVIKPGMDSSQVLARFEAERQALALMDHPNIARVLDAGAVGSEQWAASSEEKANSGQLPTAHCPLPTAHCWNAVLRHGTCQGHPHHQVL